MLDNDLTIDNTGLSITYEKSDGLTVDHRTGLAKLYLAQALLVLERSFSAVFRSRNLNSMMSTSTGRVIKLIWDINNITVFKFGLKK